MLAARPAAALIALLALPALAAAQPKPGVAVLGFRTPPGGLSAATVQHLDAVLWQRVAAVSPVPPTSEDQVEAVLGTPAVRDCADESCMWQLARATGLGKLVWGYATATPAGGFSLLVQVVDPASGPGATEDAGCPSCREAEMLAYFSGWDARRLGLSPAAMLVPVGVTPPREPEKAKSNVPPPPPKPVATTGRLTLTTKPQGAKVLLDGAELGVAPLDEAELAAGTHEVTVSLAGYETERRTVVVQVGKKSAVALKLRPSGGALAVSSKPKGAAVSIDGQVVGVTPLSDVPLSLGSHEVRLSAAGYEESVRVVKVKRGKTTKVKAKLKRVK